MVLEMLLNKGTHSEIAILTRCKRFRRINRKLLACDRRRTTCGCRQIMEDLDEIEPPLGVKYTMMV